MDKAVIKNDTHQLKYLIQIGNDINTKYFEGNTPLHIAIEKEASEMILFLLQNGANVNLKNDRHHSPFHLAVETNLKIVQLLLHYGADLHATDENGQTPLGRAAEIANNFEIAEFLIENGADPNAKNDFGITPLHNACGSKHNFEMVKLMIEHGADVSAKDHDGETPLHSASYFSYNFEKMKLLLQLGVDPNVASADGQRPLHTAVFIENNIESVKLLINFGADINAKDNFGSSPFMMACASRNNIEIVKYLYEIGADICVKDRLGYGPLHRAITNQTEENINIIEFLIEIGVEVDELNDHNKTPLHEAVIVGNPENIEILLENGADVRFDQKQIDKLYKMSEEYPDILIAKRVIRKHLVKLKKLNLAGEDVFEIWRIPVKQIKGWKRFEEACENEVVKLREEICSSRNVKFFDLLIKSLYSVAVFLTVDEIRENLSRVNLDETFPIYSGMLKSKIKKCTKLATLINDGYKSLQNILNQFQVSDVVMQKILTFLNAKDLETLNSIFEPIQSNEV